MDVPRKGRSIALAIVVGACGPSVDEPQDDNSGSGGGTPSGNAGDDGSEDAPGVDEGDDGNPYDECIASRFYVETNCWGASGVEVPDTCEGCSCATAECNHDSDCPAPSGNVMPECRDGACVLRCDDDGDCPANMRCGMLRSDDSFPVCAEVLDDPLACAAMFSNGGWLDPCPAFSDKASCEALTSELGFACKWSTQSLYQVPSDECLPVEVTESCVMTQNPLPTDFTPGVCDPNGLCAATDTRVFVEDIGGGTVRLIAYDDCERYHLPLIDTQGNPVEPCNYSSTTFPLPSVCECACE